MIWPSAELDGEISQDALDDIQQLVFFVLTTAHGGIDIFLKAKRLGIR